MIPLAHWLVEKAREDHLRILTTPDTPKESVALCAKDDDQDETQAGSLVHVARLQELEHALREAEERFAHMAHEHARKEGELIDQLGDALSHKLAEEVRMAFHSLAENIEESVVEVLMPFLETTVRERAAASLVDLIRQDMRNRDSAVLEIRAPASLHGPLGEALGKTGIAVTISESATVDVVFTGERQRFQDLASAWSAAITKDEG